MRYEYIAVYKVDGISWSSEQPDKEIASLPEYEATAILTVNLEKHCFNADRGRAISALMLSGLLGTSSESDFEARLEEQLTTIRGQRERAGKGAFLVYRGAGEKDNFDGEDIKDFGEFGFYFSDSAGSPVKERFQNSVNGVLAALSLSLDAGISPRIDKVTEYS